MDVSLQTYSADKRLEFRTIRKTGSRDYSCLLVIESRGFQANRAFHFDDPQLEAFLDDLTVMQARLEGEAILRHSFEEDRISFKISSLGRVVVSGFLVEQSECHQELHFCFETDQTVLGPLLSEFRALKL